MQRKLKCIILGSSAGIGKAIAKSLSTSGQQVVGLARSLACDVDYVQEQSDAATSGGRSKIHGIIQSFDPDALFFCIGRSEADSILSVSDERIRQMLETNLLGAVTSVQAMATLPKRQGRSIVLVSSVHARGRPDRFSYAVSKGALETVMASSFEDLMALGIRINCIRPGPTDTNMLKRLYPDNSQERKGYLDQIPSRKFSTPNEIADAAIFLACEKSSNTTGQVLTVSGGF